MILGAVHELTEADAAIRAPLPLSRRIGVVAVDGGSGASAVATTLANLLARRRSGPVLAVDAAGGRSGLWRRAVGVDVESTAARAAAAARRETAATLVAAQDGLPRTMTGAHVLDLAGPDREAAPVAHWMQRVTPIARFFDLVVTDWGVRPAVADLSSAAATSHVLVLVARSDRVSAAAAVTALTGLGEPARGGAVLVLSDVARAADRIAGSLHRATEVDVQLLPWDRSWSEAPSDRRRRFRTRTRRAHIRLAVAVMDAAVRSRQAESLTRDGLTGGELRAGVRS